MASDIEIKRIPQLPKYGSVTGATFENETGTTENLAVYDASDDTTKQVTVSQLQNVRNWVAQTYKKNPSIVIVDNVQYQLNIGVGVGQVSLPFVSTNFTTELAADNWIPFTAVNNFDWIDFNPQSPLPSNVEYRLFADPINKVLSYYRSDSTVPVWIGSINFVPFRNDTGDTLLKGTPISATGFDPIAGAITVTPTIANDRTLSELFVGIVESDVLDGEIGRGSRFDFIVNFNTSGWSVGDRLYVSAETASLTNVEPRCPNYSLLSGTVEVVDAVNGVIGIEVNNLVNDDTTSNLCGLINGVVTFAPQVDFSVSGGVIYADVTNEQEPTKDLPFIIDGKRYLLNTTTNTGAGGAARVIVPAGLSSTDLQESIIYAYLNGGSPDIGIATTTPVVPYAKISGQAVFDATRTLSDGKPFAYRRANNAIDWLDGTHDGSAGMIEQIVEAIRDKLGSNWQSGQDATPTVNDTTIRLALSAGIGRQFRLANLPLFDGLSYIIYNDASNNVTYQNSTNLTDITSDANGNSLLSNNRYYTIRIEYQLNSNGIGNNIIATRPLGFYTTSDEAVNDSNRYTVSVNDTKIEEFVFPLYDLVIGRTGTGGSTISLIQLTDLRSKLPSRVGGGGASGGGGLDDKVRITANDTTNDYLNAKITVGNELAKATINPSGNEALLITYKGWIYNAARTFYGAISAALLTANRTYTLPDRDITFAGTDELTDFVEEEKQTLAVVANNIDLDWDSKEQLLGVNLLAVSANATITRSNATNAKRANYFVNITNLATLTFPSGTYMQEFEETNSRWVDTTRVFTPASNGVYEIVETKVGSDYYLKISDLYVGS